MKQKEFAHNSSSEDYSDDSATSRSSGDDEEYSSDVSSSLEDDEEAILEEVRPKSVVTVGSLGGNFPHQLVPERKAKV